MADQAHALIPEAQMGFVGLARDEETLLPTPYMESLPESLAGRPVYVLDPMLATGGSMVHTIELLIGRGATDVTAICALAAPEGLFTLAAAELGGAGGHRVGGRAAQRFRATSCPGSVTPAIGSSAPSDGRIAGRCGDHPLGALRPATIPNGEGITSTRRATAVEQYVPPPSADERDTEPRPRRNEGSGYTW